MDYQDYQKMTAPQLGDEYRRRGLSNKPRPKRKSDIILALAADDLKPKPFDRAARDALQARPVRLVTHRFGSARDRRRGASVGVSGYNLSMERSSTGSPLLAESKNGLAVGTAVPHEPPPMVPFPKPRNVSGLLAKIKEMTS